MHIIGTDFIKVRCPGLCERTQFAVRNGPICVVAAQAQGWNDYAADAALKMVERRESHRDCVFIRAAWRAIRIGLMGLGVISSAST